MKLLTKVCLLPFLHLLYWVTSVDNKSQYVEPLNSGLQFSIPYDAGNIFVRPIAASITTFLAIAMCFILFFGVITSPFGYVFGIPSRKYVLGSESEIQHTQTAGIKRSLDESTFDAASKLYEMLSSYSKYDVSNSMYYLLPEDKDGRQYYEDCNSLMICYAHGIFKKLPAPVLRFYQFFSRRLLNGSEDLRMAVKAGLKGFKNCGEVYSGCPFSPFKLVARSMKKFLPSSWGKHVRREDVRK